MVPPLRRGDGRNMLRPYGITCTYPSQLPPGKVSDAVPASASQRALGGEAGAAGVAVGGGVLLLDDEQRVVR